MKRFNCKGLSLVEVVVAALLMSLMAGALFAVYINAKNMIALSTHKMFATQLAKKEIERYRGSVRLNASPNTRNYLLEQKNGEIGTAVCCIPPVHPTYPGQEELIALYHLRTCTVTWTE